jgi:DNA-binding transcriptional LysR family regulator
MGIYGIKRKFNDMDFDQLPFVIPYQDLEGSPSKAKGTDGWPDYKYKRSIKYQVGMMETALGFCRSGQAVGYFPEFVVKLHNGLVKKAFQLEKIEVDIKLKDKQDVFMIKRTTDTESKIFKKISKSIRNI